MDAHDYSNHVIVVVIELHINTTEKKKSMMTQSP